MLAGWVRGGAFAQHAEWEEGATRALVHYRRAGWPSSTCVGHIAAALYHGPAPATAAVVRCESLLEHDVDDLGGEANVAVYLAGLRAMVGDFAAADELLARARGIFGELGRVPALLRTCAPVGAAVERLRGDDERAIAVLQESCDALVAANDGFYVATQSAELAGLLAVAGRRKEAEARLAAATQHAREDDVISQLWLGIAAAEVALLRGERDDAVAAARTAVELGATTSATNLRAETHVALARALGGDDEELGAALALYEEKENAAAADRVRRS
jgi:hypothetical protein